MSVPDYFLIKNRVNRQRAEAEMKVDEAEVATRGQAADHWQS